MNIFKKISNGLFIFEKYVVMVLVAVMCLILFSSVALRYVFNAPIYWSGEVAIYALVWTSFIGGSMGIKLEQAVTVTALTDKLKENVRNIVFMVGWFIVLLFSLYLLFYTLKWISLPSMTVQKSDALQIPIIYPYLIMPYAFFSIGIHSLAKFVEHIDIVRKGGNN